MNETERKAKEEACQDAANGAVGIVSGILGKAQRVEVLACGEVREVPNADEHVASSFSVHVPVGGPTEEKKEPSLESWGSQ